MIKWILSSLTIVVGLAFVGWLGNELSGSRSHQLVGHLLTRVETSDSIVAFTFDDGPTPHHTDSVLAILAEHDAKATFFMVGSSMDRNPAVVARVLEQGHEIGNHSYTHRRLVLRRPGAIGEEVARTDSLIRTAGQVGDIFMRPPYGKRLVALPLHLARQGRPVVLWDLEPDTYHRQADGMVDYVLARVRPGSIVLLHVEIPGRVQNRAALRRMLPELRARGYRFVTLSELTR